MQHSFGLLVQNIGPPVAFIDAEQADPAPTNMKFGIYSRLYQDDNNSLHLMFDANKLLVATYTEMDWNGDGKIGNGFTEEQNEECRLNTSQDGCSDWTSPSSDENDEYSHILSNNIGIHYNKFVTSGDFMNMENAIPFDQTNE